MNMHTLGIYHCRIAESFFHPDFTVGTGIAPVPAHMRSRTVTAGGEFHPALKILFSSSKEYHGCGILSRTAFCGRLKKENDRLCVQGSP